MTAIQKVHVIRLLPTGNSPTARTERAQLQASRWLIPGAPNDEGVAGRAYLVTHDVAAALLRKGWTLCDKSGKPIVGEAPSVPDTMRNGTEAWYALPPDQRPGTEEYREAQLELRLQEAYAVEQANLAKEHETGAHSATAIDDCPVCAGAAVDAASQPSGAPDGAQGQQEAPQTAPGGADGQPAGSGAPAPSPDSQQTAVPPRRAK